MTTNPDEIRNIIEALGRKNLSEGDIRGIHLGKVLLYLQQKKNENYNDTLYKLALLLGMNIRYVKENYLKGLELFGVIDTQMVKNDLFWRWKGDICFNGSDIKNIESATEYMQKKSENKKK